jgi:hypothetical protein
VPGPGELYVAPLFANHLLELARHIIERVAQRNVDVLVVVAIGDELLVAGHAHVDPDPEMAALMVMLAQLLDGHAATDDPRMKLLKLGGLLPDVRLERRTEARRGW